jgi:2-hydroxychromene-2-carboxylate isomerase
MDSVRFYFSFRSPYSWLAFHRIDRIVDECPVRFEYIPVAPSKAFQVGASVNPRGPVTIRIGGVAVAPHPSRIGPTGGKLR